MSGKSWDWVAEPDPDWGHVNGALVDELALAEPGGHGAELPELGKAVFDGAALFVTADVEGGRPAARGARVTVSLCAGSR